MIENFDKALSHPDADDLERLKQADHRVAAVQIFLHGFQDLVKRQRQVREILKVAEQYIWRIKEEMR